MLPNKFLSPAMEAARSCNGNYRDAERLMAKFCWIEGDYVILKDYAPIELSRLDTPEKLHRWCFHLTEKQWMTTILLRYFMVLVSNHHGFKLYGPI